MSMLSSQTDPCQYCSSQAGDFLTRPTSVSDTETQNNLSNYDEFVEHVQEFHQEMKCTVNEISQLKDRISSIENEIKTLKLFLVSLDKCDNDAGFI